MTNSSPSRRAEVTSDAKSLPEFGSDMPMPSGFTSEHVRQKLCLLIFSTKGDEWTHLSVCEPCGSKSSAAMSSSPMMRRSIAGRPPPPYSAGHVRPIQPFRPSLEQTLSVSVDPRVGMPPVLFDCGPSEFAGLLTKCLLLFGPGEFHVVSSVMPWARSRARGDAPPLAWS